MSRAPFGNDPAKIEKYVAFWSREDVKRPLVGFTFIGWFPLEEFTACKAWSSSPVPDTGHDCPAGVYGRLHPLAKGRRDCR